MIYTFYSYKGGVGRSMAIANVAELFYRVGLKVLLVDWDLEAPGLERFFPDRMNDVLNNPGVIDLLLDYKVKMRQERPAEDKPTGFPFASPADCKVDLYPTRKSKGRLWLLPAGRRWGPALEDYAQAVRTFDWQDFYQNWEGELYFEWLRQRFEEIADNILIDSRTGISEIGGISTYQMADVVVMLTAPNAQNLDGTLDMARDFTKPQVQSLRQDRPLRVLPIPARVEDRSENELLNTFRADFIQKLGAFMPPALGNNPEVLWQSKIPYVPYYAFYELVAVREKDHARNEDLVKAYGLLAQNLASLAPTASDPEQDAHRAVKQYLRFALADANWCLPAEGEKPPRPLPPDTATEVAAPPPMAPLPPCPYPGLAPFTRDLANVFFGRSQEIDELLHRLRLQNVIWIIGPSGSGKSSLVLAGLVPQLQLRQGDRWQIRVIRPGPNTRNLEDAIHGLEESDDAAEAATQGVSSIQPLKKLLIVDQLEEIFTQANKAERDRFITLIKDIIARRAITPVVTMRADYYPDLASSGLWPIQPSEQFLLMPLSRAQLAEAIQKPAEMMGVTFESGLLERLIADAGDEPGALPLLQETLVLLWDKMERRTLTLKAYEEMGRGDQSGLSVAIAWQADAALAELSPEEQRVARRIFVRLVQFGEGGRDTRRQQPVSALRAADDNPDLFSRTLRRLCNKRLLVLSAASSGEEYVDIAHEALISGWPQLQSWIAEQRKDEQLRRNLEEAALDWERSGKDSSFLYRGSRLEEVGGWLASASAKGLGADERMTQFLEASHKRRLNEALTIAISISSTVIALIVIVATNILASNFIRDFGFVIVAALVTNPSCDLTNS